MYGLRMHSLTQDIVIFIRGFSTVLLVEDSLTHERYAIKKIVCHGLDDQRLAVKEVEYHSMLKHPNIIECIDSTHKGTADPVVNATSEVLLVLPYYHVSINLYINDFYCINIKNISIIDWQLQKGTLASELEKRARNEDHLSPLEVLNIFLQICEGVKAFHEAKPEPLAHRDLKTANIVLGDGCTPVIMDLGKISSQN